MNDLRIEAFGRSRPGLALHRRRDQFAIAALRTTLRLDQGQLETNHLRRESRTEGRVLVLTDELEGTRTAHRASHAAVDGLVAELLDEVPWKHFACGDPRDVVPALRDTLERARADVRSRSGEDALGALVRMNLAFFAGPHLYLAGAGRAPCYLWRDGVLENLVDSPVVGDPNGITVRHYEPQAGDVLALLSGGLAKSRPMDAVERVMRSGLNPRAMCLQLLGKGVGTRPRTAILARIQPRKSADVPAEAFDRPQLSKQKSVPEVRVAASVPRVAPAHPTDGLGHTVVTPVA